MEQVVSVAGYDWAPHFGVTICRHVFDGEPVRLFCFDSDRSIQFLCGADNHTDNSDLAVHAGLNHLLDHHPEVGTIPDMEPGQWAERSNENSDWVVGQLDADDFEKGETR